MSYISLYRKWRSNDFDELIGQPAIVQTLKNAIKNNRLAHAYLFSGPRGTGKTSTARILAKALNCSKGPTEKPCGLCSNCEKIKAGHSVNVIEIDAASNRGIDQMRELRERIRYAPVEGLYKVYIIDEVHMLTSEAFNALLKTLEEPPKHTIFVLATTELQKVPLTIISRCQRLDFGRIKLAEIRKHLKMIAQQEGFKIEAKALDLISQVSEGCMRDAVSLLDQLVSFAGQEITYNNVVLLLGTADEELLFSFADHIASGDIAAVLQLIEKGLEEGRSMSQVTRDLVGHFRNLLHIKVGSGEILELTDEHLKHLQEQAKQFNLEKIKQTIKSLSRAELDMKWHPHSRLVLEVALLELLETREADVVRAVPASRQVSKSEVRQPPAQPKTQNETPVAPAVTTDGTLTKIKLHWKAILESVKKKSIFGYVSLHEGKPLEVNDKGKLIVAFKKGYAFHKDRLEEVKNKDSVEEAIRENIGEKVPIECIINDGAGQPPAISANMVADFFEGRIVQ